MSSKIPIVFVHFTDDIYLPLSLYQAKYVNPGSDIYLLSPLEKHRDRFKGIVCLDTADYSASGKDLEKIYYHQSTNPYDFELKCLLRWFILNDFALQHHLSELLYLDSDVLLYDTPESIHQSFPSKGFTLADGQSPHCLYIADTQLLKDFCHSIIEYYKNKEKDIHVSDMFFFHRFGKNHPELVCELLYPVNGLVVDNNINNPDGFVMDASAERKQVEFGDGKPYFISIHQNKIRTLAMHFQGKAKAAMVHYVSWPMSRAEKWKHITYWTLKKTYRRLRS